MTYILILIILGGGTAGFSPAVTSVTFQSQTSCMAAGSAMQTAIDKYNANAVWQCVAGS
jgi:hypothetical protein